MSWSLERVDCRSAVVSRALVLVVVAAASLVGACDRSHEQRVAQFREAEKHFAGGEYEAALDDYQAFLRKFPNHRLASTAKLRIRAINQEVRAVMDRERMPAPRHVAESQDETPSPSNTSPDAGDGA